MNTRLGLRDNPIDTVEEESLGLDKYARALTEFIAKCETPMTVALQGDWGCGKTSLMNLIKNYLGNQKAGIIWFNTWQYSQFKQEENLPMLLISHLVNAIGSKDSKKWLDDLWRISRKATEVALLGAATVVGQKDTMKALTEAVNRGEAPQDSATIIRGLRDKLEKAVLERKQRENLDRFVIFIDDLDRLKPVRAVELLEYLKLFFDLEHCVFLLAIDYHIVVEGLRDKFGSAEAARTGKHFFDKIIQVPFNMPVENYQVNEYIKKLLDQISVTYDDYDLDLYRTMMERSIGFNPRTLKRILNSLHLLRLVGREMGLYDCEDGTGATGADRIRILFGTLCIQFAFPHLYAFLNNHERKSHVIDVFSTHDWIDMEEFEPLRKALYRDSAARGYEKNLMPERVKYVMERSARFMKVFLKAIKLKSSTSEESLTEDDIRHFFKMTNFSIVIRREEAINSTRD
ncbi:MAG: P-loop NTPase fold protein [Candidatus Xenobiia bacterium LiM19]